MFGNLFKQVNEVEEDVAKKKRQYDTSSFVEDWIVFTKLGARLQHALIF